MPTEQTAIVRDDCPIFHDVDLLHPSGLHSRTCPGRLHRGPCRCGSPRWLLRKREQVTVLEAGEHSSMVTADLTASKRSAAVWVEAQALMDIRVRKAKSRPVANPRRDIEVLLAWVALHGFPIYKRRRIVPVGGDIVLLRTDHTERTYNWWRLLAHTTNDVLLIDPHLTPTQALQTTWGQQLQVPGTAPRLLLPVFPLPDGTLSPGWR